MDYGRIFMWSWGASTAGGIVLTLWYFTGWQPLAILGLVLIIPLGAIMIFMSVGLVVIRLGEAVEYMKDWAERWL